MLALEIRADIAPGDLDKSAAARLAERELILHHLRERQELLNVERALLLKGPGLL